MSLVSCDSVYSRSVAPALLCLFCSERIQVQLTARTVELILQTRLKLQLDDQIKLCSITKSPRMLSVYGVPICDPRKIFAAPAYFGPH